MKALTCLITIIISFNLPCIHANEKGNGGGGVQENGVYKTFYSAKLVIKEEPELEIPGSDIYLQTIKSLVSNGDVATNLITSAMPLGNRSFYRVLEEQMDKELMAGLIAEYIKVSGMPKDHLTIFAITDTKEQITYLLPPFYKLSKVEQAAIIFHEAYWIMNPDADYNEVVSAEMAFQEYAEKSQKGIFSNKLPRLLSKMTGSKTLALTAALQADARSQTVPTLIDSKGRIAISNLFGEKCSWRSSEFPWTLESTMISMSLECDIEKKDIQDMITLSKKYPKSAFVREFIEYLVQGNNFPYRTSIREEVLLKRREKFMKEKYKEAGTFHYIEF